MNMERQANLFAVDLLCPPESVKKAVAAGATIAELAEKYQVEECVTCEALKKSNKVGRELMRKERDGWTHTELCQIAETWLLRNNRCRVAIAEPACMATLEQPDAIGWSASASWLIEAKVSRSDFFADRKKDFRIHSHKGMGNYRYYICKPGIISLGDLPTGWGLLHVTSRGTCRTIKQSMRFREINTGDERNLLAACLYICKPLKVKTVYSPSVLTIGEEASHAN